MKIFDEKEVNKASLQYSTLIHSTDELDSIEAEAFAAGVEYAESKVEDLCIEFLDYCINHSKVYSDDDGDIDLTESSKDIFKQFLEHKSKSNEKG